MTAPEHTAAAGIGALHPSLAHHIVNTLGWRSLRPLQREAITPVMAGHDALLLAPTAGGKTEAAAFPLLSRMADDGWGGLSVLYVCPLKALLNNLHPRLSEYAAWTGRMVGIRHGDTPAGQRRRQLVDPPDVLLTTPESIEAMLTSTLVDEQHLFANVRAVVVDEVHAFAGDDRGWHLLAVLDRLEHITGHPIQRIGLSATVGNPDELLTWLQGRGAGTRPATIVAPTPSPTARVAEAASTVPELVLDYVGSARNAARVIAALGRGEKRLVFCDARRRVEEVAGALNDLDVETYVSHSSLSLDERRRAEAAFAAARDCVIVSTSTLELGIDVGDLDRVLQIGAPGTAASMLQRLGRTGRRPASTRNMTFLAIDDTELLRAAGLLHLHGQGYVEPITAPPRPLHIAAQQLLALALQKGHIDPRHEAQALAALGLGSRSDLDAITGWLLATGHLDSDGGLAFVGPTAERAYGRKHFLELLAVFTTPPEITVLHGRDEIGSLDPATLMLETDAPRIIALAGRAWKVTSIDWRHRRAFVEPSDQTGRTRWSGGTATYTRALTQAIRAVLLGDNPAGVHLSQRATTRLDALRNEYEPRVQHDATVIRDEPTGRRWWTFTGLKTNAALTAALTHVTPHLAGDGRYDNLSIHVADDTTAPKLAAALRDAYTRYGHDLTGVDPVISDDALRQLKFHDLLPPHLATSTLAARTRETTPAPGNTLLAVAAPTHTHAPTR